jgi:Uncharacterised protein conserved in bacteria (DUF2313)
MAEVLFGQQLTVGATAVLDAKRAVRLTSGRTGVTASANVGAIRVVRVDRAKGSPLGRATIAARQSLRIRYIKGNVNADATFSGKLIRITPAQGSGTATADVPNRNMVIRKYVSARVNASTSVAADSDKYKTISAQMTTTSKLEYYHTDRDLRYEMTNYMPRYYEDIREAMKVIATEANEFTKSRALLEQVCDQFFVESAGYSLDRWEQIVGITPSLSRTEEERRRYVIAKLKRKIPTTVAAINDMADAFYESEVTDLPKENLVKIKITGQRGVPDNFKDMEESIRDVVPAHLEVRFETTSADWSEIEASAITLGDMDSYKFIDIERGYYKSPIYTWGHFEEIVANELDSINFNTVDSTIKPSKGDS